jgi:hypothetical protein
MQSALLMTIYVLTAIVLQCVGFLISRAVDYQWPTAGLLTFLIFFMTAYGFAWPIAVRITEALLRYAGLAVETEQSGGQVSRDAERGIVRK